jgi:anti-sigma factor RsiW
MGCADIQELLHAYVDGELDLVRGLEVERHLRDCPGCARAHDALLSLRAALRTEAPRFAPPAALRDRVRSSLRRADPDAAARRRMPWRGLAVAASLAFVLVAGSWGARLWLLASRDDRVAQEVASSHIRSLMPGHVPGVESSDRHTVKPWFLGKVPFAFPVGDFTAEGFRLIGGRLDQVGGRRVAGLVYKRREHVINLLIWPAPQEPNRPPRARTVQGFHAVHWTRGEMTFWAVSDLNLTELEQFVRLVQEQ